MAVAPASVSHRLRAYGGAVRVIAGISRGRIIRAPSGTVTRPTADRVREAIFDILANVVDLDGARVADLFAGSGAMGIEALSRGAGSVVFVDRDPAALKVVRSNLAAAGLEDAQTEIVRADVLAWLSGSRSPGERGLDESGATGRPGPLAGRSGPPGSGRPRRFDLALCDPPYAFEQWGELLERLEADLAVLESDRDVEIPETWDVVRNRRYGGTLVTVIRAAGTQPILGSHRGDDVRGPEAVTRTDSKSRRCKP